MSPSPSSLDPEQWALAVSLFEQIAEAGPAAQEAVRSRLADAPEPVRELVRQMLDSDRASHTLLDGGVDRLSHLTTAAGEPASRAGHRLGPYRIIRELGRGGMGVVYVAEREAADFKQTVALKCLPLGAAGTAQVQRFVRERRILAGLVHPHIAQLYDGGITESGEPYFVMEYVEGIRVDRYADREQLDLEQRLRLFLTVCQAVQFAHQHLVVHRDLKPANVLVTTDGHVKLLDFGIAKLLEAEGSDTSATAPALTPEYASPEQLRGEPVTVATDVFSLGLILFELLTGRRAFIPAPGPLGVVHAILECEPARASVAAGANHRLSRRLRGDLDTILEKALRKDPAHRYLAVQALHDDIRRHLDGRPVLARRAGRLSRLAGFTRRHRLAVTAGVAVTLALIGGLGVALWQGSVAARERDAARIETAKSRATTQFLQQLLGDAYPSVARGQQFSMTDLLHRAVDRIDSLGNQPDLQAQLLRTLGDVYREQGRFDEALALLERAVVLYQAAGQSRSREAGSVLSALGQLHYEKKDFQAAFRTHREELALVQALLAPDDSLVLYAMNNLAAAASALGQHDTALQMHQEVLSRRRRFFADTSQLVHVSHNNLGDLHSQMGNLAEAEREFSEALTLRRAALPPDHPSIALTLNNLGTTLVDLGRFEEAERLHRESLAIWQRVYGPEHHRVGLGAYNLAKVLERTGRLAGAESLYRVSLAIDKKSYGARHLDVGLDLRNVGLVQSRMGNCPVAVRTLKEADAIFAHNGVAPGHRRRITTRGAAGSCLVLMGRYPEAERTLLEVYRAAHLPDATVDSATAREARERVVDLYLAWGRPGQADRYRAEPGSQ
ncbi:MAG TPA: serine/threonine-protein kinase [Gemmatimonadales bacterium]